MWFDNLMDDCKQTLLLTSKYKGVFTPIFLKLAMNIIIGIIMTIGLVSTIASGIFAGINEANVFETVISILAPISIFMIIGYITYLILWGLIEVGSINLYRAAINDEKPTKAHFFNGIKSYMLRLSSGKLLIHFISVVLFPIWITLLIIYSIIIGIPTGGWGVVFLTVSISAYFASWTIAIVHDDLGIIVGIKASFRLARNNFKTLFVIMLSLMLISKYAVMLLGPLGLVLAGWFIGGVVKTYFKILVYITYIRCTNEQKLMPFEDEIF